jgi:ring-1,2-phenylacetyl-CoA epoxidase subunit PaaB
LKINSLDPRIDRAGLSAANPEFPLPEEGDQMETWEVFHIGVRGAHAVHVGSLHAPNAEVALLFAKEQYARRMKCVSLWVVRTSDISTIGGEEDSDIFETTTSKDYREARGYRVGGKITAFKRKNATSNE